MSYGNIDTQTLTTAVYRGFSLSGQGAHAAVDVHADPSNTASVYVVFVGAGAQSPTNLSTHGEAYILPAGGLLIGGPDTSAASDVYIQSGTTGQKVTFVEKLQAASNTTIIGAASGGGGGGGAATIADGADVAEGSTTQSAIANPSTNGSVLQVLRGMWTTLLAGIGITGTVTANAGTNLNTSAIKAGGTTETKPPANIATVDWTSGSSPALPANITGVFFNSSGTFIFDAGGSTNIVRTVAPGQLTIPPGINITKIYSQANGGSATIGDVQS